MYIHRAQMNLSSIKMHRWRISSHKSQFIMLVLSLFDSISVTLWHLRSFRKILEEYLFSTFMMSYYLIFNLHSLLRLTFDFLIHSIMYNNFILILIRTSVKKRLKNEVYYINSTLFKYKLNCYIVSFIF